MEIRPSMAQTAYLTARPSIVPTEKPPGTGAALESAAANFAATLQNGETVARDAMIGKADPHALVMALTQTELAVETAATLRDKVVEAYQEILRMPV